jgi:hypothetical protein
MMLAMVVSNAPHNVSADIRSNPSAKPQQVRRGQNARNKYLAALTLLLLPAISVELLTGDTTLRNFFNPVAFGVLTITYGGALLLMRETVVRWGQGFASVLVFAAGYGMVNEALTSKGFFDPHFYAVAANGLEGFGRWFGINVPWSISISIFHATFSVIVPLVIVSAIFPGRERWLGNKTYAALMAAFVAIVTFSFRVLSPPATHYRYNEGPGPLSLILALLALDIVVAWKLPELHPSRWRLRLPSSALFGLGIVYAFAYFVSTRILHAEASPVAFVALDLLLFAAVPIVLLLKLPEPSSRGKVALAAGLLFPMMLTAARGGGPGRVFAAIIVLVLIALAWARCPSTEP